MYLYSGAEFTSSVCSGELSAPPGTYTGHVTVTDDPDQGGSGCSDDVETDEVVICAPIAATADLTATCTSSFDYDVSVSGGCDAANATVAWTFSGGPTTPSTSTMRSGSVNVGTPAIPYTGAVVVTDARSDLPGVCTASDSDMATPYAPLMVHLTPDNESLTCPMTSDAVTYTASVTGGTGSHSFAWSGVCSANLGPTCTVDDPDLDFCVDNTYTFNVTVTDDEPICTDATSEDETYHKVMTTTVTATDN